MAKPPIDLFWVEKNASKKYWVMDKTFSKPTNKEVVNEYFQSMEISDMSELTILHYKHTLETYFVRKEEDFSTISFDEILQWFIQQQKGGVDKANDIYRESDY